jgi:membrane associated rhomboid family serine protease
MLIPIGDQNKKGTGPAWITLLLIAANFFVFFYFQGGGRDIEFTVGYSVIPYEITHGEDITQPRTKEVGDQEVTIPHAPGPPIIYLTILTAMFMHGGLLHLLSNMLFLWIFGDNVEHRFGAIAFILFYLISGVVGTFSQIAVAPESIIPNLGASGAISGVLGAYLVLFPRNRVYALFFYFIISIPAVIAIGVWIALQLVSGYMEMVDPAPGIGGVAYMAHIGGFFAGAILAMVLRVFIKKERENIFSKQAERDRSRQYW